jgi:uncharacterized surface protein with fasciclin (FAS1) repeats
MELPPLSTLRHILDRLKANDIAWFKDQWKSGGFGWMKDRVGDAEYDNIGKRIEAGDLGAMRGALGKIDAPGMDLFKGLGVGAAGAAAVGGAGAAAKKFGNGDDDDRKKKGAWIWLPVLAVVIGLLAWLLTQCGGSTAEEEFTEDTAVEETIADTVAETLPAETTLAAVPDTVAPETVAAAPAAGDIVDTAIAAGSFKTLTAAVSAAGLVDTLKGPGPFTVFAPTDDAFAKLPAGLVDALLKPENKDTLSKVLTYHVLPGNIPAADVTAGEFDTVEGSKVTITTEGGVKINDANVTATDVAASNGVIHVIDSVIVPPSVDVAALLAAPAADTTVAATPDTTVAAAPDTTVAAAPDTTVAAPVVPEGLTVYFGNGSARLDAEAQAKIDGAVETLRALPAGTKVAIVGHASARGSKAQNERLSDARAKNVQAALEKGLGADADKIEFSVDFRGDSEPDVDEAKSRKVTIEIQPTA